MKKEKLRIEEVVREAGKLLVNATIDKNRIEKKGHANFVTEIDYMVEKYLLKELSEIIPGSNVITEESKENDYCLEKPTWILDPVDGTTNLMYDFHHSAISLGLFLEGKPTLGIIYNPTGNEMFIAEHGKGAVLNGKEINVTTNNTIGDSLIAFGTTPYERDKTDKTFEIVKNIYLCCRDIRRTGSAALDMAYVACGRLDGFLEMKLQPWDFAAGSIILEEAGGIVSDWNGENLSLLTPCGVIASNGYIHNKLLEIISQ